MKRFFLVLAVAALMAMMLVVLSAPAFAGQAKGQNGTNFGREQNQFNFGVSTSNGSSNGGGDLFNTSNGEGNRFGDPQN